MTLNSIFICILFASLSITASAQDRTISVTQYELEAIALYKELRLLKINGHLYNDCSVGSCAPQAVKDWYKKWKYFNSTRPSDGFPDLRMSDNNSVTVSDLHDIVVNAYSDRDIVKCCV